jgi:hypothetical protein
MSSLRRSLLSVLVSFLLWSPVLAQKGNSPATVVVTATAAAGHIRFAAPSSVVQIRVEVYDAAGVRIFDDEVRGGNVLDWHLQDGQAEQVADGSYLCVVTAKGSSGRISQKLGTATIANAVATVEASGDARLTKQQLEAVGPIEENGMLTVLQEGEVKTPTVIAHNGEDGQIVRGKGALSFRLGDFYSGQDKEQMRLTEEGNLGIGTTKPTTRLDVAGAIRAGEGFMFSDGSKLNVNDKGVLTRTGADGAAPDSVSSTQNKIAKFTDNAGTLADSSLTDTGGNVGFGVASPGDLLDIAGPPNPSGRSGLHVRTTTTTGNSTLYFDNDRGNFSAYGGLLTGGSANSFLFFGVTRADKTFLLADGPSSLGLGIGTLVSQPVILGTANTERMRIQGTGEVGIGRTDPWYKLDVNGDINTSTFYRINGNRVLNSGNAGSFSAGPAGDISAGSVNTFFGFFAGGANGISTANTFVGAQAGYSNQTGSNNSFLGYSAGILSTGNRNIFIGSEAGKNNISGNSNVFVGTLAGKTNGSGGFNTILGTDADVSTGILDHATAIGAGAVVNTSNTMVLGRGDGSDTVEIPGALNVTGSLGIGTTAPVNILHLNGNQSNFALTFTNQANTAGKRGYRIAFDNDRFTFQSADDSGNFAANQMTIDPATGNVGIGTVGPHAKLQVAGGSIYVTNPNGLIISAPNGTCWQIGVSNTGTLTTIATPCP